MWSAAEWNESGGSDLVGRCGDRRGERDRAGVGNGAQRGFLEIRTRVDSGQLGALDQRVEQRGDKRAAFGARAVVDFAPDGRTSLILPMSSFERVSTTGGTPRSAPMSRFST